MEEDSGRALPDCARAVTVENDREIDKAINLRIRIQLPLSVFDGWFDSIKSWEQTLCGNSSPLLATEGEGTGHPADLNRRLRQADTRPALGRASLIQLEINFDVDHHRHWLAMLGCGCELPAANSLSRTPVQSRV